MSVTANQVEAAIKDKLAEGYYGDYFWGDLEWDVKRGHLTALTIDGETLPVEFVESEEGGEGDWETEVWVVFKVGDQYFRKTGYYASHSGTEWDGPMTEVHRVKKVIKVWENK